MLRFRPLGHSVMIVMKQKYFTYSQYRVHFKLLIHPHQTRPYNQHIIPVTSILFTDQGPFLFIGINNT